jgi:solute carrier family 29 (equilibrative nucleoside transporter), member 1/2/3
VAHSVLLLTVFISLSPNVLFGLVILVCLGLAAAAAYLQTAVMALSSLFGSQAVQAVMSGQAAVGVAVSVLQVISASGSKASKAADTIHPRTRDAEPEKKTDWGALAFFTIATAFLVLSLGAQRFITRTKEYQMILSETEEEQLVNSEEAQHLVSSYASFDSVADLYNAPPPPPLTPMEMLKVNKVYNAAIALVFIVTLVRFERPAR